MKNKDFEIDYCGIDVLVNGVYDEGEKGYMYDYNGHGLPDTPHSFEVEEVFVEDTNIISLLSAKQIEEIEQLILEQYYENY